VLQGEREMAGDNRTLGKFHLVGIPPAPRGIPQVEVTFDIDANGIVNVSAKDLGTGKEQQITITASSGLNEEDIKKMVRDSEVHSEEDKRRRQDIETRNHLDNLIYTTEKTLNENREKIPVSEISPLEEAISEGKKALESQDMDRVRKVMDQLTKASHKLAETMYKESQARSASSAGGPEGGQQAGPPPPGAGGKPEGDVVDAEFEDLGKK